MLPFTYINGVLHAEDASLTALAEEHGTPLYVYSAVKIRHQFTRFQTAVDTARNGKPKNLIAYAMKANGNLSVLRLVAEMGGGADIVSGGELFRALKAGIPPENIIFSGVGKTAEEIAYALENGICQFNIETHDEFNLIEQQAIALNKIAPVAFRLTPDIDSETHHKTMTGSHATKFGLDLDTIRDLYARAAASPHLKPMGLSTHIGSQLTQIAPVRTALNILSTFAKDLVEEGYDVPRLDLGGGLGICYKDERPITPEDFAAMLAPIFDWFNGPLAFEPGRFITGDSGILLTTIVAVKHTPAKRFIIVDAGMNDLMRPALYDAWHDCLPVVEGKGNISPVDIVGPVCETGDIFAADRPMPDLKIGDLVVFKNAGAYGAVMASHYNARPRVAEVMVEGDNIKVVRRRETFEDLVRGES